MLCSAGGAFSIFADVLRRLKKNHWLLYSRQEIAKACVLLDVKIESCDGADKQIKKQALHSCPIFSAMDGLYFLSIY